jgi:hypothetical protein
MLPDGTTGTNEWHKSDVGETEEALVQSDDGASSYIYEQASAYQEITFTMADPSVAEEDIDFNEDVTVTPYMHADYTFVGFGADSGAPHTYTYLKIQLTGTDIFLGAFSRTLTTEDGSYPAYSGGTGTDMAIFTPWTYAGLQNCQVKLENTSRPARFHPIRVTYVYIEVDYTPAVSADNATFFGANF